MQKEISIEDIKTFLERITSNKDFLYVIQPLGLADILCAGGFSYAAQAKKNKSATVLIVQEGAENFGLDYDNVKKISCVSPKILSAIQKYLDDEKIFETDNFIYGYLNMKGTKDFTVNEGLNLLDYYREKIYKLPLNTPCRPPIIQKISDEEISYWHQKYILDKERTIILSTYVNTENVSKIKCWADFAQKLIEKNFIVYTYVEQFSNKPIPGTQPIFANFSELAYIAGNVKCFISSRSGVSTFLSMATDAKIFFITSFPMWFLEMKKNFPNSNCHTFYNLWDFAESLMEAADKDGAIVQAEFSHPKINSADVFYSLDDILKNIFKELCQ